MSDVQETQADLGLNALEQQIEELFLQADTAMIKENNYKLAEELYCKIRDLERDNVHALNGISYCKQHFDKQEESFSLLSEAQQIDPTDYETNFNLGIYHLDVSKEMAQALKLFQASLEEADTNGQKVKSLFNLAKVHEEKEDWQAAIELYNKILSIDENDYKTLVNLAVIKEQQGSMAEANVLLERAKNIKGTGQRILANLSIIKQQESAQSESHCNLGKDLEHFGTETLQDFEEEVSHVQTDANQGQKDKHQGPRVPETQDKSKLIRAESDDSLSQDEKDDKEEKTDEEAAIISDQVQSAPQSKAPGFKRQATKNVPLNPQEANKALQLKKGTESNNSKEIIEEEEYDDEVLSEDEELNSQGDAVREESNEDEPQETDEDKGQGSQDKRSVQSSDKQDDSLVEKQQEEAVIGPSSKEPIQGGVSHRRADPVQDSIEEHKENLVFEKVDKSVKLFTSEDRLSPGSKKNSMHAFNHKKESNSSIRYAHNNDDDEYEDLEAFNNPVHSRRSRCDSKYKQTLGQSMDLREEDLQDSAQKENAFIRLRIPTRTSLVENEETCWGNWTTRTCNYKLSLDENNLQAMFRLAQLMIEVGNYSKAQQLLNRVSSTDADFMRPEVIMLKLQIFDNMGQLEKSIDLYDQLIDIQKQESELSLSEGEDKLFEAIFQKGKCFERMKNFNGAVLTYIECTTLGKIHSKVYLRLAQCYKKLNYFEKAANNLEQAVQMEKEADDSEQTRHLVEHMLNLVVILYQNLQDYDKCWDYANQVLELEPDNGSALIILGRISEKRGLKETAVGYFERSVTIKSHSLESNFRLGKIYEKLGNKKKAISHYKNCLNIKNSHYESLVSLAMLLLSKEQYERSLKYFKHALLLKNEDLEVLFGYSMALYRNCIVGSSGNQNKDISLYKVSTQQSSALQPSEANKTVKINPDIDTAIQTLVKITTIDSQHNAAFRLLGEIYFASKDYDKAVEQLKQALQINKHDPECLVLLGKVLQETGNLEIAAKYYKQALKYDSTDISAMIFLGNTTYNLGRFQEAAKYYEKVLGADDQMSEVHYELGNTYFNLKMVQKAIYHYKMATQINSNKAQYFYNLGNALSMMDNYCQAIIEYEQAIKLDPANGTSALFNKGNSHYFLDQYECAIEAYLRSIELNPKQSDCHFNVANAYQEIKQYEQAIKHLKIVTELGVKTEEAYLNLAAIYKVHLKDQEQAIKIYEHMTKDYPNNKQVQRELAKFKNKIK